MDSFESLIAMLLANDGYWTATSIKVELTKKEKCRIERSSCPRWEVDVVGYRGSTNELLVVECKSFLDSTGVIFRNGKFESQKNRYKLFTERNIWTVVSDRLVQQLTERGYCRGRPKVTLCLAAGHIAKKSDRIGMHKHFKERGWLLFDEDWIKERLKMATVSEFENDVAHVVAKILLR